MAGKSRGSILQEPGVFDGGGTNDDVLQACVDVTLNRVQVADTAAQLHGNVVAHGFQDAFDGGEVLRFARKSAVQIDQVQAARAFVDPCTSRGGTPCGAM